MSTHDFLDLVPSIDDSPGLFIGGTAVPAEEYENVMNPATGMAVGVQPLAGKVEVNRAVEAAAVAEVSTMSARRRGAVLLRWAQMLQEHRESLAQLATSEMGKPLTESRGEVDRACAEIEYAAGEAPRMTGETIPGDHPESLVITERVPLGVIAAITPWNFPIVAPVRKVAPAFAAGNSVVLKPAKETPLTALAIMALLGEAGCPPGGINVVSGYGSVAGSALAAHAQVDGISFTGSTSRGRGLAERAGRDLKPVQLELGGKNAAYVHSAGDLGKVADEIVSAAMQCTGQRCTAISRVIVEEEVADELVAELVARVKVLPVGPGTDADTKIGPLVSTQHLESVADYVRRGLAAGAQQVTADRPVPDDGPYMAPVIFDHVRPDMDIAREEIFGPVLAVLRTNGVDEAVALTNATEYGLASSVFTTEMGVALRFLRGVDAGMIHVNHGTASEPHVPFGGVNGSGMGAFSIGDTAKDFYTRTKVGYLRKEITS